MTQAPPADFLHSIQHLRQYEEVVLFGKLSSYSKEEQDAVVSFLEREYQHESLDYPQEVPEYNAQAALWAAQTVYTAAQLLLYRSQNEQDIAGMFPAYDGSITASAILSADLSLRFLPHLLRQLELIDPDDRLIPVLEKVLQQWHYSAVQPTSTFKKEQIEVVTNNKCLHQLYINRIIQYKNLDLARSDAFNIGVKSALGIYADVYWKEFFN